MKTHVHDVTFFVPLLKDTIDQIENYPGRALLTSEAAVVYKDPDVEPYVQYLRDMNFGPKKVWQVENKGKTLFHAIDQSPKKQEILQRSDAIIPFSSWGETNQFKYNWSLSDKQWQCQPESVHKKLENKIRFREILPDNLFADYEIAYTFSDLQQKGEEMLAKHQALVVRSPKRASGVGSKIIGDKKSFYTQECEDFFYEYGDKGLLIEEFIDEGKEFSIIWDVSTDREVNFLCWTSQFIKDRVHQGNLVGEKEQVFPWKSDKLTDEIKQTTKEIVDKYNYPGRIGFDIVADQEGNWKIFECNCRFGGSSYPNFIREQTKKDRCVVMHNIKPDLPSFREVHQVFEKLDLAYNEEEETGALVANPLCLPEKCAVVIVDKNPQQAENKLNRVLDYFE